jgi:hypothetical protein
MTYAGGDETEEGMKLEALCSLAAASVVILAGPQAVAQSGSGGWEYAIAPYLWAAGMDGSMTVAAIEADVDVPFDTIIEDLDIAFMGHFDMRNERWVLSSDLIYVDLEDNVEVAQGTGTATVEETLLEVAGGYRVSPALALLVGARWVDLSSGLQYSGPAVQGSVDASKSWIDPFVGAHSTAPLSDRWFVGIRGDIGGVGVGSELAWQAYADVGWKASDVVSVIVGYRVIDMDYEDGSGLEYFHYDLQIAGPQLGVAFRF